MKQAVLAALVLTAASIVLVSCGNNYNYTNTGVATVANPATIKVHVFVSNPLFPSGVSTSAVLNVVDGQTDTAFPQLCLGRSDQPQPWPDGTFPE